MCGIDFPGHRGRHSFLDVNRGPVRLAARARVKQRTETTYLGCGT